MRDERSSFLTYEPYYGLNEKAFSLSADPRFLYKSRTHATAYEEVRAGIKRREGIIVLTGEPGTGKTTMCRSVVGALDRQTFCAFLPDPFVSREDLLKMLLIEFGPAPSSAIRCTNF
jgi:type II secretory pathway predicted ATPase ExeA